MESFGHVAFVGARHAAGLSKLGFRFARILDSQRPASDKVG